MRGNSRNSRERTRIILKNNSELAKNSEIFEKEKRTRGELSLAAANVNRTWKRYSARKFMRFERFTLRSA